MADRFRIVRSDRPHRWRWVFWAIAAIAILVVLAAAGWGLYHYARGAAQARIEHADLRSRKLMATRQNLRGQLEAEQKRATKLAAQLAYIQQSHQINGDACKLVKQSLGELQGENSKLKKQLAFYRGIVSPKASATGLRVYTLSLTPRRHAPRDYDFDLVIVQSLHQGQNVRGVALVQIEGLQGAKPTSYKLSDLAMGSSGKLAFSFKYFQEIDGSFRLPAGFQPVRVVVSLIPGGNMPKVEESYDWAKIEQSAGVSK
ncbi:MAG: hypothetical protein L0H29_02270, partial [Sinobacteraceae bacterium]|nr:hypothetical protein [Nevskiaceae bacterium]